MNMSNEVTIMSKSHILNMFEHACLSQPSNISFYFTRLSYELLLGGNTLVCTKQLWHISGETTPMYQGGQIDKGMSHRNARQR